MTDPAPSPPADPVRRALPDGATLGTWHAPDGWPLRTFDWPAPAGRERGAILFQTGRGDFFEKYLETLAYWHSRGWRITAFDWRGQAGSGRLTPAPHVGHIDDYATYIADLRAFWAEWAAGVTGPKVAIGHSMGGHLLLRGLAEGAIAPDAAVLVAPMLGLHAPGGAAIGERVARLIGALGKPARPAWKGNERPHTMIPRQKLLTTDLDRYADELWWQQQDPRLITGPPSWRWVVQGFESTRLLRASPALATLSTPVLMLVAEADRLVDPRAALAVAAKLPDVRVVRFGAESAHEILRECDAVRDRALVEIDDFLETRVGVQG
ncbi:alpha/beta hydrolase [Sphingomonas donggukensis]|uniref:Alpha/beta hydrolase n=1 Tax=Sphingomonas donggukensis TaxID=2949093 RepID=A0ABY4TUB1_9SPHN|nr:alpha/beta hydrolase [Sphingomonas donggukensis]URW75986.1 alpha/beta hydrolase [Sphingomonas donggukensis]